MKTRSAAKMMFHRLSAIAMSIALTTMSSSIPAKACAPEFDLAVMINGNHPDLPLKLFAAGKLGVIQPGWAQSYLVVSYRYLSGIPLDAKEQASMLHLWHRRLNSMQATRWDPNKDYSSMAYFRLRAKTLGQKLKPDANQYDFNFAANVSDSAFANAAKNLQFLQKRFGEQSAAVKDWVQAQDAVFGMNKSAKQSEPHALEANADPVLKFQRDYQIAAAKFYANDLDQAKTMFEALAKQGGPYWQDLAMYMAVRAAVTEAFDANDSQTSKDALEYTNKIISESGKSIYHEDIVDLAEWISYQISPPAQKPDLAVKAALKLHNSRLGNDIEELTCLLDSALPTFMGPPSGPEGAQKNGHPAEAIQPEKYDLTDWIASFQEPDCGWWSDDDIKGLTERRQKKAAHSLAKWRETHSVPWLIAAVSNQNLLDTKNKDLTAAASKITPESPAFLTARFYVIDALMKTNQAAHAHQLVTETLSRKDLNPSARNLFMCQALACAKNLEAVKKNIVQKTVSIGISNDSTQLPPNWLKAENNANYYSSEAYTSKILSSDINANMPLSHWISWAKDKSLPKSLHARIVRTAWLRSKLLGQDAGLDDELLASYPRMNKMMAAYKAAPAGPEKDFSLACLILKYEGMSPYLQAGIERHGLDIASLDMYNANFWMPYKTTEPPRFQLPEYYNAPPWEDSTNYAGAKSMLDLFDSYSKPLVRKLLTAKEKTDLELERKTFWEKPPSKFLGEPIIKWANAHPEDPRVPEALYRVLKLPRWTYATAIGSKYSKEAYKILHEQHPKSTWTKKAVCWY